MQSAIHDGAYVVGVTGGPEKVAQLREAGASAAVDYRSDDWVEQVTAVLGDRKVTVVLDGVGGAIGRRRWSCWAWAAG